MTELPNVYMVRVKPALAPHWLSMFSVLEATIIYGDNDLSQTALLGRVADQAQLMGILGEMHGMGLQLLSVQHQSPVEVQA